MEKRFVRVANAILDLEPYSRGEQKNAETEFNSLILNRQKNEFGACPSAEAIHSVTEFIESQKLRFHPDPDAIELKNRLSEYAGLPAEFISCFAGTSIALDKIFRTYLETGTELVASGPIPADISILAGSTGARTVEVEHDNPLSPAIEDIVNLITPKTRAIYLANPNHITGASFGEAEIVFLLAYAERSMVIVDEEYFEYSTKTLNGLISRFPNLILIRSFARGFGLGAVKASYVITDPQNLQYIERIKCGSGPDAVAQASAMAVLSNFDHMREYMAGISQSKKTLANNLVDIGYEFKITQSDIVLLRVNNPVEAVTALREEGIPARDIAFLSNLGGYIGVSIGLPEQTDKLLLFLSRMAEKFATGLNRNRIQKQQTPSVNRIKKTVNVN